MPQLHTRRSPLNSLPPIFTSAHQGRFYSVLVDPGKLIDDSVQFLKKQKFSMACPWLIKFNTYNVPEKDPDDLAVALRVCDEGELLYHQGYYVEAQDKFEVALDVLNDFLGSLNVAHSAVAHVLFAVAENMRLQGEFESSALLYEKCMGMWRKLYGEDSLCVARAYHGKGCLMRARRC